MAQVVFSSACQSNARGEAKKKPSSILSVGFEDHPLRINSPSEVITEGLRCDLADLRVITLLVLDSEGRQEMGEIP